MVEELPLFQSAKTMQMEMSSFHKASHSSVLEPATTENLPLFQTAKSLDKTALPGFQKASNKENEGTLMPSKEALLKAQLKMKRWEEDWIDLDTPVEETTEPPPPPSFATAAALTSKPKLADPLPPTPAPVPSQVAYTPTPTTQSRPLGFSSQSKPFRVPTFKNVGKAPSSTPGPSQSPFRPPTFTNLSTPLRSHNRLSFTTPGPSTSTPLVSSKLASPAPSPRSIGLSRTSKSTFKTPFKKDVQLNPVQQLLKQNMLNNSQMAPTTPLSSRRYPPSTFKVPASPLATSKQPVTPMRQPPRPLPVKDPCPSKQTLDACGLQPQEYSLEELESMGLNTTELSQITPVTALHYGFYSPDGVPSPTSGLPRLNADAAYKELLTKGCSLASKPWVDNHWSMILWKLAGMAAFDPVTEQDPARKRWCWAEVMRQLTYRYEKELNGGQRPALRRIVATDSPAGNPIVLCVSGINWIEGEKGSFPELEVTDGWYRLRAQIDPPMVRAIQKGTLRVGRKIAVVGARLLSEKKDPMEILEAYDSVKLALSGNSTHLAPWHAKLGFQRDRYISTLRALSPDGGFISCVDVEILKVHPVAYLEFVEKDGQTIREGPRSEADENKIADQWMKRREKEASKLRYEYERRNERYMDYVQRLEDKAHSYRPKEDDGPPDSVDSCYDDLEDHRTALQTISRLTPAEAHWLSKTIRHNLESEHDRMNSEVEKELAALCPPRNVRNFRVLVVKDAREGRKQSHRVAQLTVWDVTSLALSEGGKPGSFEVGQRYMVSNLYPAQPSAWMKNEPGAEIYMTARKGSQWLRMRH
ncbi:hypothetical protein CC2G_000587 [Coprinopsis cinerea AmutBmut pab1-1]|nr:hypothetical protein CC2G_000587 [Coprinopsis cinerea AmutBmut pab1-1]